MAVLYIMMTLTYWFDISKVSEAKTDGNLLTIAGMAPVWIKIVSTWVCAIIYTWTLVAPALLPDREFGFN